MCRLRIQKVDAVPPDADVAHYDELPERAKHLLPEIVEGGEQSVVETRRADFVSEFDPFEYVKFVDYYLIQSQ